MKKNLIGAISVLLLSMVIIVSCEEERKSPPLIQNVEVSGTGPYTVKAKVLDDNGPLKSVELFFKKNSENTFTSVSMNKDGDFYYGEIPKQTQGDKIYYYIKAVNSVDLIAYEPAGAPAATLQFEVGGIDYSGLVLNEIWAGGTTDQHKFIELFNKSNAPIDISGVYFERNNDGKIGTIPDNTILAAGAYYILGTKNNTTNPRDPNAPYDSSVTSGFSAKKSIRFKVMSPLGNQIDIFLRGSEDNLDVTISDLAPKSYCRIPNGTGPWKVVDNATLRAANDPTGAADIPND